MCTVSFVPTLEGDFILTSNRDENINRAATSLEKLELKNKHVFFPQDPKLKGSWLVFSNTNQFVCVLNGAFKHHKPKGPYRLSRGIMALQFFEYKDSSDFFENFYFKQIEPFTLIVFDMDTLIEARWDGYDLLLKPLSVLEIHLWSSSTLYPQSWQKERYTKLNKSIAEQSLEPNQLAIMEFHKNEFLFEQTALAEIYGGNALPEKVKVETISVSSIKGNNTSFDFNYKRIDETIQFKKSVPLIRST